MPEAILRLRQYLRLLYDLLGLQSFQRFRQRKPSGMDACQHALIEDAADDSSRTDDLLGPLVQPIEPRANYRLHGIGQEQLVQGLMKNERLAINRKRTRFKHRVACLLDKQRVAIGAAGNQ